MYIRHKSSYFFSVTQVAPAELEAVLLDHPKVADSGVVGVADERAGELPRAYIVKKDASLTQEEVQSYMNGQWNIEIYNMYVP